MGKNRNPLEKFCFSSEKKKLVLIYLPVKEESGYSWRRISQGREGTKPLEKTGGNSSRVLGITGWEKKTIGKMRFLSKAAPSANGRVGKINTKAKQIPEGPQLLTSHWKFLKIWAGMG